MDRANKAKPRRFRRGSRFARQGPGGGKAPSAVLLLPALLAALTGLLTTLLPALSRLLGLLARLLLPALLLSALALLVLLALIHSMLVTHDCLQELAP
jgi:hypothetical protein